MSRAPILPRRLAALALAGLLVACTGACTGGDNALLPASQRMPSEAGGPFELVEQTGRTVTDRDFHGRAMLVYFGYANCASLCGLSLATLADAVDAVDPAGNETALVFVTLDPRRDTTELLADYVPLFHEHMRGLGGTREQVDQAARSFKVYFTVNEDGDGRFYSVDHTRWSYLIGRDGRLVQAFGPADPPELIAARLRAYLAG